MSSKINHWWSSRPKRKLITIVDVLRIFLAVTEGKQWAGNRELHRQFEQALEEQGLKGAGEKRNQQGSGGRTYAAWLLSFGLWFADSTGHTHATLAGSDLIKGELPVPIMREQILNFQYPSFFSTITRVSDRFKIHPFRFLLKLLMHPALKGSLNRDEIAFFVITQAEVEKDLEKIVELITSYRLSKNFSVDERFESVYGEVSKLRDVSNTLINQLEYTGYIQRGDRDSEITLAPSSIKEVSLKISASPVFVDRYVEQENFQRKYGLGPNHQRDNRTFGRLDTVSANDAKKSKVLLVLSDIFANSPIKGINSKLIDEIAQKTGVSSRDVEEIVITTGFFPSQTAFEEKYLQLSVGGTTYAREFEQATTGIFGKEGFGLESKWIGSKPNNPDVLAISADSEHYSGIIDTKAYKNYTIIGDHRRRMTREYIPQYKNYEYNGKNFSLAFFSYIAGGFGSTIERGLKKIFEETGVSGSAITAQNLLVLLNKHKKTPLSSAQLKNIFSLNRQLLPSDFN